MCVLESARLCRALVSLQCTFNRYMVMAEPGPRSKWMEGEVELEDGGKG